MDNLELKTWISSLIGTEITGPLFEQLRDGVILCQLTNAIYTNQVQIEKASNLFQKMANINSFLEVAKKVGVPSEELFMSPDLAEEKNYKQVEICLYSLCRHAVKKGLIENGVGPRLNDKQKYTFSEEKLLQGKMVVPKQNAGSLDPGLKMKVAGRERAGILESDEKKENSPEIGNKSVEL
ncbi:Transgelin-3 [Conglomerata obtusa]